MSSWWPPTPGAARSTGPEYAADGRRRRPAVAPPADVPRRPTVGPGHGLYPDQLLAAPGPRALGSWRAGRTRAGPARCRPRTALPSPTGCDRARPAQVGAAGGRGDTSARSASSRPPGRPCRDHGLGAGRLSPSRSSGASAAGLASCSATTARVLLARAHRPVGVITLQRHWRAGRAAPPGRRPGAPANRASAPQLVAAGLEAVRQAGARAAMLEVGYDNEPGDRALPAPRIRAAHGARELLRPGPARPDPEAVRPVSELASSPSNSVALRTRRTSVSEEAT